MKAPNHASPSPRQLLDLQAAEIARWRFCTNDLVRVYLARRLLIVNAKRLAGLKTQDLIVFHVLAEEAARPHGLPLATVELVARIEAGAKQREFGWLAVTPELVHKAVSRLRHALGHAGLNPKLIESMPGLGYRLSTPALNVSVVHPEAPKPPIREPKRWRTAAEAAPTQDPGGEDVSGARPPG
ncbi:MAG TPA: helix-turn-helix domain-containing protein [Chthoniobacteraceae bacterium]|jgi:hypothetical protein|nr:helix-turn-helix domain-containing protein [Chthoniobacteraceae bacterium]